MIVLLCKLNLVRGRSLDSKLEYLYGEFVGWLGDNFENSSIQMLSMNDFKMKTHHNSTLFGGTFPVVRRLNTMQPAITIHIMLKSTICKYKAIELSN